MFLNIILTVVLFLVTDTIYANTENTIRIGLESRYLNAQSVRINNVTISVGLSSNYGFIPSMHISSYGGFSVVVCHGVYADTGERFSDFYTASDHASHIYNGKVVLLDHGNFGVYVGPFDNVGAASAYGHVVDASNRRIRLMVNGAIVMVANNPIQLVDADGGFVHLGGRMYRGVMELGRQTGEGITPVNIVNIEEYLKSVVPSEMPASWHIEALKAQAVAARSYTSARRGSHSHLGYELCDTVFSQVYSGVEIEHYNSTLAVSLTQGLRVLYEGMPIQATYFSSSGGFTENSEDVWTNAVGYLRSVQDIHETEGMVWQRQFTLTQLTDIKRRQGVNIGYVTGVTISGHTAAGRVSRLTLNGTNGNHTIEGEAIRWFFEHSTEGSLRSRNFALAGTVAQPTTTVPTQTIVLQGAGGAITIEIPNAYAIGVSREVVNINLGDYGTITQNIVAPPQNTTSSQGYTVTINGRGWGHGVGMSQFGAKGMAEAGFTFRDILSHYYQGTVII